MKRREFTSSYETQRKHPYFLCGRCGDLAIGFFSNERNIKGYPVCIEHAPLPLLQMPPGTKKFIGSAYFYKYNV